MKRKGNTITRYFSGRRSTNTLVEESKAKYYGEQMNLCKMYNGLETYTKLV